MWFNLKGYYSEQLHNPGRKKKNKLITYITVSLNNLFYYQYPHFYFYFLQIFCTNEVSSIQGNKRKLSFVKLVKRKKVAFGGDMVKGKNWRFFSVFLVFFCCNTAWTLPPPPLIYLQWLPAFNSTTVQLKTLK